MQYENVIPGEWFSIPGRKMILACCDCGLVHTVDFKIKEGKIFIRMSRKKKMTNKLRKKLK